MVKRCQNVALVEQDQIPAFAAEVGRRRGQRDVLCTDFSLSSSFLLSRS